MPPRRSARASAAGSAPAPAPAAQRYADSPESPATTTATTTAPASGLSTPATSVGGAASVAARHPREGSLDSYASSDGSLPERRFAVIPPLPASRKRKAAAPVFAAAAPDAAEASGGSDIEFVSHAAAPKVKAEPKRSLRRTKPQRVVSPEDDGFLSGPSLGDASFSGGGGGGFFAADAPHDEPPAKSAARGNKAVPRRIEALKPLAELYSDEEEEAETTRLLAQSRAARAGETPRQLAALTANASANAPSSGSRPRPARAARPKSFKGLLSEDEEAVADSWDALSEALALRLQAEEDERVGAGGFVKHEGGFDDDDDDGGSDFGTPAPRAGPSRIKAAAAPKPRARGRATKKARIETSEEYEAPLLGSDLSDAPSDDEGAEGLQEDQRWETAIQREKRLKRRKTKKGKQSQYERAHGQFSVHHPELATVWTDLAATAEPVPQQAAQPEGLTIKLLPFQLEGLHWLKAQEASAWKGGLLADEMGMGKTIQMISLFLSDRKKPVLVVIPTVAIMQWKNEIAKYTENFKVLVWHGSDRETDAAEVQKYDVVLATYAVLESSFRKEHQGFKRKGVTIKEPSAVHAIHWHRIVLDEAHNIKERSTNTAKAAFELKGTFRWCLSGTPLQNRVGDLYSQIKFLGGDPFSFYLCKKCPCKSAYWSFENNRYCRTCGHTAMSHGNFWNQEVLKPIQRGGASHGEGGDAFKRMRLLLSRIMLRRTKIERADDMGLPPRTIVVRQDKFSEEEEDLYTSLYQEGTRKFNTYLDQGTVLNNYSNIFTLLTRMRQMACHPDLVLRSKTGMAAKMLGEAAGEGVHVCRLCTDEAEDAIMSKCRHIFCRECVRTYYESSTAEGGVPDCPQCHARLTIDLEQEELEPPAQLAEHQKGRQGILERLDMDKWRSSSKIEALVEELERSKRDDSTTKSIVFSQFVNFLDLIAFRLQRAGYKICRLEGGMSPQARDNTIQHFMKNADVTVFLVSLKAGGVALNLTEASRVYLMDPWWNGSVMAQSADRIHRLGQYRPIVIRYMVIEDSIESRILELQYKKQNMINAALSSDDAAMSRLSVADLQFLFQL